MENNTKFLNVRQNIFTRFCFVILFGAIWFQAKAMDNFNYSEYTSNLKINKEIKTGRITGETALDSAECEPPYNENASTSNVYFSKIHFEGMGAAHGNPDFDLLYISDQISPGGYRKIDNEPSIIIYSGMQSAYTIRSGPANNTDRYYYSLWIDFNQDGCFDSDEQIIWSDDNSNGLPNDVEGEILINFEDLNVASYRARIRNSKLNHPSSEGNGDGEALDFIIKVITEEEADLILNVEDQVFTDFTYYPNPIEDQVTLHAGAPIEQVEVYNLLGQKIIEKHPNVLETSLNTDDLHSGVYLMNITINGNQKTFRLIKK